MRSQLKPVYVPFNHGIVQKSKSALLITQNTFNPKYIIPLDSMCNLGGWGGGVGDSKMPEFTFFEFYA